jgi:hypothetical protein
MNNLFLYLKGNWGKDISHVLSHIRLTLAALPWKRNRLVLGRPLLATEYETTIKSLWMANPSSRKLTFHVLILSARTVSSLKIKPTQFYLGIKRCVVHWKSRYNLEDKILRKHRCENFKSYVLHVLFWDRFLLSHSKLTIFLVHTCCRLEIRCPT